MYANGPTSFWGLVKIIQNKRRKQNIGALEVERKVVTDLSEKAAALNNFFCKIRKELAKIFEANSYTNKNANNIYRVTPTMIRFTLAEILKDRNCLRKFESSKGC